MPAPIAAGVLAARIAAHIAKSPTVRKGLASAMKKFGKATVKKESKKVPQIVRGRKAAASKNVVLEYSNKTYFFRKLEIFLYIKYYERRC